MSTKMERLMISTIVIASLMDAIGFTFIGLMMVFIYLRITKKQFKATPYIIMTIVALISNIILLGNPRSLSLFNSL